VNRSEIKTIVGGNRDLDNLRTVFLIGVMTMSFLIGIIIGGILAALIPNPLIWLDDKYHDYKYRKYQKTRYDEYIAKGISEDTARYISGYTL